MKIQTRDLSHTYPQHKAEDLHALDEISLEVPSGQLVVLIGPSGCGKSTLLRILAGLLKPTRGAVFLDGFSPSQAAARKQIAWMAQKPALLPWRSVYSNVALAQEINPQNDRKTLSARDLLRLVNLTDFASAYPFSLSGGMQQRVALARTLALGAPIWLMDEPFASLDELTRERLTQEVLGLWRRFQPTILWVTHSIHEAILLADRVLVMSPRPGRIHADLPLLLSRPRDDTHSKFQDPLRTLRKALGVSP